MSTAYSAGPVNGPTMSEDQFRAFTKDAPWISNEQHTKLNYAPVVQRSNSLVSYKQPNTAY